MRLGRAHEEEKPPQIFWSPTIDANRRPVHARRHKELRRTLARARWLAEASTWWPAGPATLDPSTSARLQGLSQRPSPLSELPRRLRQSSQRRQLPVAVLRAPASACRSCRGGYTGPRSADSFPPQSRERPPPLLLAERRTMPTTPRREADSSQVARAPMCAPAAARPLGPFLLRCRPLPSEGSPRRVGRALVRFRLAVPAVPPRRLLRAHHYGAINLHPWGETTRFCIVVRLAGKMRVFSTSSIGAHYRYPKYCARCIFAYASCCWR
jgi:hypothetical protein